MNTYIIQQALSVGVEGRDERPAGTMRDPRPTNGGARRTLGAALVSIGQRISGEMPASRTTQPDADCV